MKKKSKKAFFTVLLVVIFGFSLLGVGGSIGQIWGDPNANKSTREIALSCTLDLYTKFHIHAILSIVVNGAQQTIPADTGISPTCMHPIHTHDDTGQIHIESPVQRDFTLGDFFAVWEKTFNKDQILDYKADAGHEIVMTVNGSSSDAYENLVFEDGQQIAIEYRAIQK
jgi:hypothetical protein